jgi:hypothetical protein
MLTSILNTKASALTINGGSDCSPNSVINCGVTSTQQLVNYLPGHTAILDLYSKSFGINAADISNLRNTTVHPNEDVTYAGSVNVNNDVIVNGRIVDTNAITAGRQNISNRYGSSRQVNYAGYSFFIRTPRVSFVVASIPAFVVMKNGVFQFAILTSCANPVRATAVPVTPKKTTSIATYTCDNLTLAISSTDPNTIVANVKHSQTNGATYNNVTYQFKNDTNNIITSLTAGDTNVNYSSVNSFGPQTVTATVNFTLSGRSVSATSPNCVKSITLATTPVYACTSLTLSAAASNPNTIVMNVSHIQTNGAVYKDVIYQIKNVTTGSNNTTLTSGDTNVNYTFSNYGEQSITATVEFMLNGNIVSATSPNCIRSVTIAQPSTPNYACLSITLSRDPNNPDSVIATSAYTATGGATFSGVSYDFGDNTVQVVTNPSNLTVDHTYANPGTYLVSATYTFTVGTTSETVSNANCENTVTFTPPPTAMCAIPGLAQYPANAPQCVTIIPASHLVNTGPGGVGMFASILGGVSVVSGTSYYLITRYRNRKLL